MKKIVSLLISITMLLSTVTAVPVFADDETTTTTTDNKVVDVDFGIAEDGTATMTDSCGTVPNFWKKILVSSEDAKDGSGTIYYSDFAEQSSTNLLHTTISSAYTDKFGNENTVEMWMKGQFETSGLPVYFNTNGEWTLKAHADGYLYVYKGANWIFKSSKTLFGKDDKWMHIALTRDFDGTSTVVYNLYVDGELLGTYTDESGAALSSGKNWYFGTSSNAASGAYYGGIADIKVYNDIRTAEEVAADFAADKALYIGFEDEHTIFDLSFEEGTDGAYSIVDGAGTVTSFWKNWPTVETFTAKDGSENIPYAKFVEYDANNTAGHHMIAGSGTNETVERDALRNKEKSSVELWFNAALGYNSTLEKYTRAMPFALASSNGGSNMWGIDIRYDELIVWGNGGRQIEISPDHKIRAGAWQHIVLTREQITESDDETDYIKYELYIDGELKGSKTVAGTISDGSAFPSFGQVYIATSAGYNQMYNGGLAVARMYDDILTEERVKSHYNADKAKYQTFSDEMILDIDFETDDETAAIQMSDKYGVNSSYTWNNFAVTTETAKNGDGNLVYADYTKDGPKTDSTIEWVTINGTNTGCFIGENELTIETWMKAQFKDAGATYMYLNNVWQANSYISSGNGYFEVKVKAGAAKIQNTSKIMNYKDGEWMHLVLTRDFDGDSTGVYNAYIDGELFGTVTYASDSALSANNMFFGTNSSTAASGYTGGVGDIKVYKGIMSADEVLEAYNAEKDRYLDFNEQHLIFDASFEGNAVSDNEEFATAYWSKNLAYGADANGTPYLTFDGSASQYLGFGDSGAQYEVIKPIAGNDEASVEFWLRTSDVSDKQQNIFAFHKYVNTDSMWGAYIKNGKLVHKAQYANTASDEISLGGQNKWAHIVLTRKYDETTGMTYQTYVNGVLADTKTRTDVTPADDLNGEKAKYMMFGGNYFASTATTNTFTGDIGAIRLYSGVVSAEQVAATYAKESEIFSNYEGELSVDEVFFYDESDSNELEAVGTEKSIHIYTYLTSTKATDEDVKVLVGLYDGNGMLQVVGMSEETTVYANTSSDDAAEVYAELNIPDDVTVDAAGEVRVFVWTGDDFMEPVSSEVYSLNCL